MVTSPRPSGSRRFQDPGHPQTLQRAPAVDGHSAAPIVAVASIYQSGGCLGAAHQIVPEVDPGEEILDDRLGGLDFDRYPLAAPVYHRIDLVTCGVPPEIQIGFPALMEKVLDQLRDHAAFEDG